MPTIEKVMLPEAKNEFINSVVKNALPTVQALLEAYPHLIQERSKDGATALIIAVERDYEDMAQLLLENNALVDEREVKDRSQNYYGRTPLHIAAQTGNINLLQLLLAWGADINEKMSYAILGINRWCNALDIAKHSQNIHLRFNRNHDAVVDFLKTEFHIIKMQKNKKKKSLIPALGREKKRYPFFIQNQDWLDNEDSPLLSTPDSPKEVKPLLLNTESINVNAPTTQYLSGLEIKETPLTDGHCFFHAVAFYGDKNQRELRRELVEFIKSNIQEYEPFMASVRGEIYATNEAYFNALAEKDEWADHVPIVALMKKLQRPIVVIGDNGKIRNRIDIQNYDSEPIFVYYNGHNHYKGLVSNEVESRGKEILAQLLQSESVALALPHTNSAVESDDPEPIGTPLAQLHAERHRSISNIRSRNTAAFIGPETETSLLNQIQKILQSLSQPDYTLPDAIEITIDSKTIATAVNDRRHQNFYQAYPNLETIAAQLRMQDYLNAAIFILSLYNIPPKQFLDLFYPTLEAITHSQASSDIVLKKIITIILEKINLILLPTKPSIIIVYDDLNVANHLCTWQKTMSGLITITEDSTKQFYIVQLDIPQSIKLSQEQKKMWQKINSRKPPAWFENLRPWEKIYWKNIAKKDPKFKTINRLTQPILIRRYPGLAYYLMHYLIIYDNKTQSIVMDYKTMRSGIIDPFQISDKDKTLLEQRQAIVHDNMMQSIITELPTVIKKNLAALSDYTSTFSKQKKPRLIIPILMQTLLSERRTLIDIFKKPSEAKMRHFKKQCATELQNVTTYLQAKNDEIQFLIIETNYPVDRSYSYATLTPSLQELKATALLLLRCVISQLQLLRFNSQLNESEKNRLKQLIVACNLCLTDPKNHPVEKLKILTAETKSDYLSLNFPEKLRHHFQHLLESLQHYLTLLFDPSPNYLAIAATEQNLVKIIGGMAHITCKSGKDRTAMAIMKADTENIAHILKQHSDSQSSVDEKELNLKLFFSGHHQLLAATNAAGSLGLKSVKHVLTPSLYDELKTKNLNVLEINKRCANANNKAHESDLIFVFSTEPMIESKLTFFNLRHKGTEVAPNSCDSSEQSSSLEVSNHEEIDRLFFG